MAEEVAIRQAGQVSAMPDAREITALFKMGQALAASGMFPDARQTFQAMTKLVLGRDLGLSATAAMTGIYIVEGKPELSANLQAQMVRTWLGLGGERYDYDVEGPTPEKCAVTIFRVNPGVTYGDKDNYELKGRTEFTIEKAREVGLIKPKSAWANYPENMLFARAMSNAVAFFCPEVTGGVRLYAPGEVSQSEDLGARAVASVGDFQARTEAIQEQEASETIQDVQVVEDQPVEVAEPTAGLTPEQTAEQERLDREFGATAPWSDGDLPPEDEPKFEGDPEPPAQEAPAPPTREEIEDMKRYVVQGLMELGEGEPVIAARLRGAGDNPQALQNLLKFIENKKAQAVKAQEANK